VHLRLAIQKAVESLHSNIVQSIRVTGVISTLPLRVHPIAFVANPAMVNRVYSKGQRNEQTVVTRGVRDIPGF
jgi:hypothetical protein